jgi:TPR repeat protein
MWAQEVLGEAYEQQGRNKEAVYWYKSAADLGNPFAKNKLALAYLEGKGVEADPAQAVDLYKQGADAGDREARTALAGLYATGVGVTQDLKRAASLYQLAQAAGDPWAQLKLAEMYLNGRGVPKDRQGGQTLSTCRRRRQRLRDGGARRVV